MSRLDDGTVRVRAAHYSLSLSTLTIVLISFECGHNACSGCTALLLRKPAPDCPCCRQNLDARPIYNLIVRQITEEWLTEHQMTVPSYIKTDVAAAQAIINSFYIAID